MLPDKRNASSDLRKVVTVAGTPTDTSIAYAVDFKRYLSLLFARELAKVAHLADERSGNGVKRPASTVRGVPGACWGAPFKYKN